MKSNFRDTVFDLNADVKNVRNFGSNQSEGKFETFIVLFAKQCLYVFTGNVCTCVNTGCVGAPLA